VNSSCCLSTVPPAAIPSGKPCLLDKVESKEEALIEIYRRLRPGNPATPEVAQDFIDNLFFKSTYYDLSGVGRMKINLRLGIERR
jgi:DNA-directed RNA polymerase subunit beta